MQKEKLTQFIKDNYSGESLNQLVAWISSKEFEEDLQHYIEEDLISQFNEKVDGDHEELSHIVDEILAISNLQCNGISKTTEPNNNHKTLSPAEKKSGKTISLSLVWKVAATIVVAVGIYFFSSKTDMLQETRVVTSYIIKENPKGQKSTIFMKDGSKVILNSESSISYDENFASGIREVTLDGEAFFEVAEDAKRPFVVKSGAISTTALGTSFNVCNFQEENIVVSLVTGKIRVDQDIKLSTTDEKILSPGEEITFDRINGTFNKLSYGDSEKLLWKDGILSFKKASIPDVFMRLERWYGVKINTATKEFADASYTGIYKDKSLEQVLTAMGFTLNFDFTLDKKNVEIRFKQ